MSQELSEDLHELLTGDEEGRLCKDIPESACRQQPGNFTKHLISLAATKTGDGLADPKLVLAWLLSALGAPPAAIGLLVPVRESLALLPQMFFSAQIRSLPVRKWAWAIGSAVQGLCVLALAAIAAFFDGATAGWIIVGLVAIFATARSVCSVSYKDVLGKTVAKQSRGTATGTAGTVAAVLVLAFGILMSIGVIPLNVPNICLALMFAGMLWLLAGLVFIRIVEEPGATDGGANAIARAIDQVALLQEDPQLVRFIAVRGLLTATALAPPFLLALAGQSGEKSLTTLGPFVIAASLASVVSSYVWGRFSDRSSRLVLVAAALGGGAILGLVGIASLLAPAQTSTTVMTAGALFVLMIAYQGVRLGRSTHLVDMTDQDKRASYTALSNTAIGLLLLAGGLFGFLAEQIGVEFVLVIMSAMCMAAAYLAVGLEEVQV